MCIIITSDDNLLERELVLAVNVWPYFVTILWLDIGSIYSSVCFTRIGLPYESG